MRICYNALHAGYAPSAPLSATLGFSGQEPGGVAGSGARPCRPDLCEPSRTKVPPRCVGELGSVHLPHRSSSQRTLPPQGVLLPKASAWPGPHRQLEPRPGQWNCSRKSPASHLGYKVKRSSASSIARLSRVPGLCRRHGSRCCRTRHPAGHCALASPSATSQHDPHPRPWRRRSPHSFQKSGIRLRPLHPKRTLIECCCLVIPLRSLVGTPTQTFCIQPPTRELKVRTPGWTPWDVIF